MLDFGGAKFPSHWVSAGIARVCANPDGDHGRHFVGQVNVATNGAGDGVFTITPNPPLPAGRTVTAAATGAAGDTPEFSLPRSVSAWDVRR